MHDQVNETEFHTQRLEAILRDQIEVHEQLLELLERKRGAIASADAAAIELLCRKENALIQRLGELEKMRVSIAGAITHAVAPDHNAPLRLREIAGTLEQEPQSRMLALASTLREKAERVRAVSTVLKDATEQLSAHLAGVMQVIHSALSNARIYERKGRIVAGTQVTSTIDVTS